MPFRSRELLLSARIRSRLQILLVFQDCTKTWKDRLEHAAWRLPANLLSSPPKARRSSGLYLCWMDPIAVRYSLRSTLTSWIKRALPPRELISPDALVNTLRTLFRDPNLERNAIMALRNIHQTTSVAEYHMWFIGHSQHMKINSNALAPYFYRGFQDMIKDLLAEEQNWRTFKKLQDRASRLDAHLQAQNIERK